MVYRISKVFAYIGGALLLLCALVVTADVALRSIFDIAPLFSFEMTEFGFAAAVAMGYGYALLTKCQIRIDVFYQKVSLRPRTILDIVALLALSIVVVVLTYFGAEVALRSFELGSRAQSSLGTPLVIPQTIWSLGLAWFAIICGYLIVKSVKHLMRGEHEEVSKLIGVTGDPHGH